VTWLLLTLVLGLQSVFSPAGSVPLPKATVATSASLAVLTPPPPSQSTNLDGSSGVDPWGRP
jgi:hypothetical protein